MLIPHELYRSLGNSNEKRQMTYRVFFHHELEPVILDRIRKETNGNFALGTDRFSEEVSKVPAR
jgi:putative transposase